VVTRKLGCVRELESTIGRVCPCGLIVSTQGWPYCKKMTSNNKPMVGWNILRPKSIGELFLEDTCLWFICVDIELPLFMS
jgi:hypothetical protein